MQQLLADVGHGQAFEECLRTTLKTPPLSEAKVGKWKDAAPFKFCVDGAIDGIIKGGILSADVTRRHDKAASPATHWPFMVHDGSASRISPSACASGGTCCSVGSPGKAWARMLVRIGPGL